MQSSMQNSLTRYYQPLRILFILSFIIWILIHFLPELKINEGIFYTRLEITWKNLQSGYPIGVYTLVWLLWEITWLVCALTYPQRWVFISGALIMIFFLPKYAFGWGRTAHEGLWQVRTLYYLAYGCGLSGFLAIPPRSRGELICWGPVICIVGSILAILYAPCKALGTNVGWHLILGIGDITRGIYNYQFIDAETLMMELILINGIGLTLFFIGKKQEWNQEAKLQPPEDIHYR